MPRCAAISCLGAPPWMKFRGLGEGVPAQGSIHQWANRLRLTGVPTVQKRVDMAQVASHLSCAWLVRYTGFFLLPNVRKRRKLNRIDDMPQVGL